MTRLAKGARIVPEDLTAAARLADLPYRRVSIFLESNKWMASWPVRYGLALMLTAAATVARYMMEGSFGILAFTYITYYPATFFAAVVGGTGPGILATLLSVVCADYFFIEPVGTFDMRLVDSAGALMFSVTGVGVSMLSGATRRAYQDLKATNTAVAQGAAWLRQLLEAVPEAILEVTREGRIVLVNEAAQQMFGYTRDEFLALNVEALVPEAKRSVHAQHRLDYAHQPERRPMGSGLELNGRRKDGSLFPVEISLSPHSSQDTVNVIALVRDITERRNMEAQMEANRLGLVASARLAALGMMAGGVAHEINNPLAIIQASADDLLYAAKQKGAVPLDLVVRAGERIVQTSNRIAKIVKGMRLLAREGSQDRFTAVPLSRIVEEALEICKARFRQNSVGLILPSIDPSLYVSCREVQISQVLLNLLLNAFDAVREQAGEKWIRLEVSVAGSWVELSVVDSGPGVPPELRTRIMEPFFTTKEVGKGTGLGLSLSQAIIEEHGGKLVLRDEAGHTCFSFRLPLSQEKAAACN